MSRSDKRRVLLDVVPQRRLGGKTQRKSGKRRSFAGARLRFRRRKLTRRRCAAPTSEQVGSSFPRKGGIQAASASKATSVHSLRLAGGPERRPSSGPSDHLLAWLRQTP